MVISPELANYSLRNLRMRKARSILTILSIFVGITTIFIFISFGWGLFNYVNDYTTGSAADKIIVQPKGSDSAGLDDTFNLTQKELEAVERIVGVKTATGAVITAAEVQKGNQKKFVFISSYDPRNPLIFDIFNADIREGRELTPRETGKALLGYSYLQENKVFEKPIKLGETIEIQGEKVRVVGFIDEVGNPQDDSSIYVTTEYIYELYPKRKDTYSWIVAQVENTENIDKIAEEIERAVRKSKDQEEGKEDFYVQTFEDLISSFAGSLNLIIGFVILIALISVIVSAVNTANTMITSVLERTKEIGVIKSIGAKNEEILKIFLFESATLGLIAGIIGVITGYITTNIAKQILQNLGYGFLSPEYNTTLFIGLILFATLTGAISGVIPAIKASKTNVVDALRYE